MPNLLEKFAARLGYLRKDDVQKALTANAASARHFARTRTYEAGQVTRLTADFVPSQTSIDTDLVSRLRLMRMRSRYLFKNEPYARRFGRLIQKNVVGPAGVSLSILGRDKPESPLRLSVEEAKVIEDRWLAWAASPYVTTDKRMSWRQVQRLAALNAGTDGEACLRLVVSAGNPYLLSLQFLVPDQLDEGFNSAGKTTQIKLAVESVIATGERVAYWLWARDPGDLHAPSVYTRERVRVPAGEMVHWYLSEFANQSRGVPWLFSTLPQLNMLSGYAEAELVASRVCASKMGFFVPPEGAGYTGAPPDGEGNRITEVSPGMFEELDPGTKVETFDPQHPNANFQAFQKAMLRGISAGGDVSYHTLSGDLESVNYSSARIGLLDERDGYAVLQDEFISGVCAPVFRAWLVLQATLGEIPLTAQEALTFDQVLWRPRRWSWVDPKSEIDAATAAVALRIKSRTQLCAEMGDNFVVTANELSAEQTLLDELDLVPEAPLPGAPAPLPKGPADASKNGLGEFTVPHRG